MAFMPFPVGGGQPRQQIPNYTPQLVQQGVSDLLGAVLGYMNLQQGKDTAAQNFQLQNRQQELDYEARSATNAREDRRLGLEEAHQSWLKEQALEARGDTQAERLLGLYNTQMSGYDQKGTLALEDLTKQARGTFRAASESLSPLRTEALKLVRDPARNQSREPYAEFFSTRVAPAIEAAQKETDPIKRSGRLAAINGMINEVIAPNAPQEVARSISTLYESFPDIISEGNFATVEQRLNSALRRQIAEGKLSAMDKSTGVLSGFRGTRDYATAIKDMRDIVPGLPRDLSELSFDAPTPRQIAVPPVQEPDVLSNFENWTNRGFTALGESLGGYQDPVYAAPNDQGGTYAPAVPITNQSKVAPYQPALQGGVNGDLEAMFLQSIRGNQ